MSLQHCSQVRIADAYSVYLLDAEARRYSPATLEHYRYRLSPFVQFCAENNVEYLEQLSSVHVRRYLLLRQQTGNAPDTLHTEARALRAWFNWCVAEGWLSQSPMHNIPMPQRPKHILSAFEPDEADRLLAAAKHPRDRAIVLTLLDTGLRASELTALNGKHIDISAGTIWVQKGKGEKDRVVYIGARTAKAILRYYAWRGTPNAEEHVWVSLKTGGRLTRYGLRQMLQRLGKIADVQSATPHAFRRTFALWSLRAGMNIYVLQRLMGHEDIETLRQYLPLVQNDLENAHRKFGPVDNWKG